MAALSCFKAVLKPKRFSYRSGLKNQSVFLGLEEPKEVSPRLDTKGLAERLNRRRQVQSPGTLRHRRGV